MSIEDAILATETKSKQYFNFLIQEDWMLVY